MVVHHSETLRLTTWEDMRWGAMRGHPYQLYSPLPYLPHTVLVRLARSFLEIEDKRVIRQVARLGGLPIAALQFWIIYLIARLLLRSRWHALLAALGVNLLPQLRYLHAYVNADATSILMASLCAWLLLRLILGDRPTGTTALFTGLALAGLALVRYNTWLVGFPLVGAFVFNTLVKRKDLRQRIRLLATAGLLPLLLAGWFHVHVYTELSNGQVLGGKAHLELIRSTFDGVPTRLDVTAKGRYHELGTIWKSATGNFTRIGSLPRWFRNSMFLGILIGTAFVFFAVKRTRTATAGVCALYFSIGFGVSLLTYLSLAIQPQIRVQGRLLLAALPFTPTLLCGVDQVLKQKPSTQPLRLTLIASFVAFMFLGNILMIRML